MIVGRGRSGRCAALVVLGSPTGLLTTPWWTGTSSPTAINFATSLASAGDVNNDGYLDIIAGDFSANQSAGAAYLFLNSPTGLASTPQVLQEASMLSIGFFGFSIAAAGDVNADGYSDVVVGARSFATGSEREGAAFVYLGNPSGLSTVSTSLGNVGARRGMDFGWNVAGRGDLNADGYDDVLVSAPGFVTPLLGQVGRVYAYFGSPSGVSVQPQWFTDGLHQDARIGNGLSYAGDVDSDGFDDLLVGAPYFGLQGDFAGQVTLYQGLGPLLAASTSTVSLLSGGTVQLQVTAGSRMANKAYFLLGTGSGTTPGTPFGGSVIPLNFDPYFVLTASAQAGLLSGGLGLIDGSSRATAQFIVPPNTNPAFLGVTLHHACLLFDLPGTTALVGVSHPIALTAVP